MTLDDFVKAGVVNHLAHWTEPTYELAGGGVSRPEVIVQASGRVDMIVDDYLTPTQLRALSSMCLWAAEQVEAKEKR